MEEIRKKLFEIQDLKYKEFHSKLCPNIDRIIGVRIPNLKEMAKDIVKKDYVKFLKEIEDEYYEELVLHGLVIGYAPITIEDTFKYLEQFIPKINSWAVCDTTCSNLKITKKYTEKMWEFLKQYINSDKQYEIRFAIVMYLNYFLTDEYIDEILSIMDKTKNKEYYVQMAIAWLISLAYIKQKEKTEKYIMNNNLEPDIQNKAIQKICESYRVSDEDKMKVKKYKK